MFGPKSRLNVRILPVEIAGEQESWYDIKEDYLTRTVNGVHFNPTDSELDFQFNRSPFEFSVARKSTGDVLFSTKGSKLVFENQFLEFRTELPEKYNLYGLGEVMHNFRLGNKYNRTLYATDVRYVILGLLLQHSSRYSPPTSAIRSTRIFMGLILFTTSIATLS